MGERIVAAKTRPFWEKALEFATVAGSVATHGGFVDERVYQERLSSCRSCPEIDRGSGDGQEYCGACDCGRWPVARLDRKLYFPALKCPLGRAGFANAGEAVGPDGWKKCEGCSKPDPIRTPFELGQAVLIAVRLPSEPPDESPWRVEARRNDVYDLMRRRPFFSRAWPFFSWSWWRHWGRPERATVSRDALAQAPVK